MNQLVGKTLADRYEVQKEIGRGGMARVYQAFDSRLQRMVALKVLAPQLSIDQEFVKRFEREASMAAGLGHPSIVTVFDRGEYEGLLYISMEYIDGRTLHAILQDHGVLGLGAAVSILDPICKALDYAHRQGAVHRDIKPHNIMIALDGRVLLADFGIAQPAEADHEGLTRTGTFMGTPEYISPEQTESRRVDGKSDLYSLAIVAYEIVTGQVPFSGNTPQLLIAHTQTPPPPPSSVVDDVPRELDIFFARALAKDPQARFASGAVLVEEMRRIAERYQLSLAVSSQTTFLAGLAAPDSSAGKPTLVVDQGATPKAGHVPAFGASDQSAGVGEGTVAQVTGIAGENPDSFGSAASVASYGSVGTPGQPPSSGGGGASVAANQDDRRKLLLWMGAAVVAVIIVVALMAVFAGGNGGGDETPVPASPTTTMPVVETPTATSPAPPDNQATPIPPTETPIPPTAVPIPPTDTPLVSRYTPTPPTATPMPPTEVPMPPTATPIPPTETPVPPTIPPTPTPMPPTATPAYPAPGAQPPSYPLASTELVEN